MNIASVTFCAKSPIDIKKAASSAKTENDTPVRRRRKQTDKTFGADEFVTKNIKKKAPGIIKTAAAFAAGIATAFTVNFAKTPHPEAVITIPFDANTTSINEVADVYGTDENIIKLNNEIYDYTDLSQITTLDIPTEYDCVQNKIDEKQDKLFSDKLSEEERDSLETEVQDLKFKQTLQHEVAKTYTDGKFVYFALNDLSIDSAYQNGINVEDFKELFDIEDGAVRKYNSLENCSWNVDENGSSVDFTNCYLQSGTIIKVEKDAIK